MEGWQKKMASQHNLRTRIHNTWPFARDGLPFIAGGGFLTVFSFLLGWSIIGTILGVLTLFILSFFRDPERDSAAAKEAVLTPADGRILAVRELIDRQNFYGEPGIKISIFMSVFNVHVNRVPSSGKIVNIVYRPGKFFSAHLDKASEKNERNAITMETDGGQRIKFVQIAGLVARRIVCWIEKEDQVIRGERFGLIRFGSRLDVYIPPQSRVVVQGGDKVKAGKTVLGYLP
jgi:phosphatidylserine decarboxylase